MSCQKAWYLISRISTVFDQMPQQEGFAQPFSTHFHSRFALICYVWNCIFNTKHIDPLLPLPIQAFVLCWLLVLDASSDLNPHPHCFLLDKHDDGKLVKVNAL